MANLNKYSVLVTLFVWHVIFVPFQIPVVQACQICAPYPEKTLADQLLENDQIIFAREVADSPYVFYPIEVIKGPAVTESFKMFCDSATRMKLKIYPDDVVVIGRKSTNNDLQMIAYADSDIQSFIRTIISIGGNWPDQSNPDDRLHFFAKLLNSENPRIGEQAYLEIGKAPYSLIKDLAPEIPKERIYNLLSNYRLVEWRNLYILMLGQSRDPDDLEFIRKKVESAARYGLSQNLTAWVTAFIESHPEVGVEEVETMYFIPSKRTKDEIEQVLTAMSVLGSQTTSFDPRIFRLRTQIVKSYKTLLDNYPEMAGKVAKDFAAWQVQAYVDRIAEISRNEPAVLDPPSAFSVDSYLSLAPGFKKIDFAK